METRAPRQDRAFVRERVRRCRYGSREEDEAPRGRPARGVPTHPQADAAAAEGREGPAPRARGSASATRHRGGAVTFADRRDAGRRLGAAVASRGTPPAVTLAIPRGGVIVGAEVAGALGGPFEVVVPRKLGAPGNPELGIGAVASGVRVLDARAIAQLGIPAAHLEREIVAQEAEVERREREYRRGRPPVRLEGMTAVVTDDGIATGVTAIAALRWARNAGAARVVLAVPVAPPATLRRLADEADDVIALETPPRFLAVGEWYDDFAQTTDAEVLAALERGYAA